MQQSRKIYFPLWKFLNQPIFDRQGKPILNPRLFWRIHSIELLERCLAKDFSSYDGLRE